MVKRLTGDKIKTRGLFDLKDTLLKSTYNIFMCCNVLPELYGEDRGFTRRINIIDFPISFKEKPKRLNERKLKEFSESEIEDEIKKILKERNIKEKDIISLSKIIENKYKEITFCERKKIERQQYRNIYIGLKNI
jgi:phage/plasmid-associated DNA primase